MKVLQAREEALENEYIYRHSLSFRLLSHRTRILGLMVADAMGLDDTDADEYAQKLVGIYARNYSDDDVVDEIICDLHDIGISELRSEIHRKMREAELMADEDLYR
jgi:hypothetical protein